ncbi:MAG TPA: phosphatidylserine decarboxylase [Candidatus Nanoarchaeia archaeon]|nr:phosphatidylserine decarboxylase [Candidatus Nanoarchaeia archaeon]
MYILIGIVVLLLLWYKLWFLRDPDRKIPAGNNIVSPADGQVIKIMPFDNTEIIVEKGLAGKIKVLTEDVALEGHIVSIFMSPMNVHVNRSPIKGEVKYVKYHSGKFMPAKLFDAVFENENAQVLIVNKNLRIKVIQIAGILARRIVSYLKPGQWVEKGERIGLIKLGSQCTLVLPKQVKLKVKEGNYVYGGSTIIGSF